MAAYCARAGVALAPHGKTAMSPELAARQLAHGAWGITVASIGQLQVYRSFGFSRLLLANELTDATGIAWLAGELAADPGFEAYCYVDSPDGVAILDTQLRRHPAGRPLPVLVEIGHAGGRTGCRTDEQALAVAKAAQASGTLTVAGVAGYEGSIGGASERQTLSEVAAFCRRLRGLADALGDAPGDAPGITGGPRIVTAGGSAYFDVVTRELTAVPAVHGPGVAVPVQVILRSGAYLTYDHGFYGTVSPAGRSAAGRRRCGPRWSCGPRCCPGPSRAWPCWARAGATSASTRASRYRCGCSAAIPARPAGPLPNSTTSTLTCGWAPRPILGRVTWSAWAFRIRVPRSTGGGSWWC